MSDDLISRQAAIDALMAWEEDSIWDEECLKHRGEPYWVAPSDVINQLPSVQPEIIRCKDCKYYTRMWYCEAWNNSPGFPAVSDDMFCSLAERREDE